MFGARPAPPRALVVTVDEAPVAIAGRFYDTVGTAMHARRGEFTIELTRLLSPETQQKTVTYQVVDAIEADFAAANSKRRIVCAGDSDEAIATRLGVEIGILAATSTKGDCVVVIIDRSRVAQELRLLKGRLRVARDVSVPLIVIDVNIMRECETTLHNLEMEAKAQEQDKEVTQIVQELVESVV